MEKSFFDFYFGILENTTLTLRYIMLRTFTFIIYYLRDLLVLVDQIELPSHESVTPVQYEPFWCLTPFYESNRARRSHAAKQRAGRRVTTALASHIIFVLTGNDKKKKRTAMSCAVIFLAKMSTFQPTKTLLRLDAVSEVQTRTCFKTISNGWI